MLALAGCSSGSPAAAPTLPPVRHSLPPTLAALSPDPAPVRSTLSPSGRPPSRLPPATPSRRTGVAVAGHPLHGLVITLDPGHNGANAQHPAEISRLVDAGGFRKPCNTTGTASDGGYPEATFTWQLAGRLRDLLQQRGATVALTRPGNTGWGPCVDARGRFGASVHAVLELSLHADGAGATGHGFHVIVPAYRRGWTDDILGPSARFGSTVRDALRGAGFTPSTYAGSDGIQVRSDLGTLNLADVPTAMVECGNMRNPADAAVLASAAGQGRYAGALAAAISRYLGR